MDVTGNTTRDDKRQLKKERFAMSNEGQKRFRDICNTPGNETDIKEILAEFKDAFLNCVPERFRGPDDRDPLEQKDRQKRGEWLVYGRPQKRKDGSIVRTGGDVGRARVLAENELEHRYFGCRDVPELQAFAQMREVQFEPNLNAEVKAITRSLLPKGVCHNIEWSEDKGLHVHILGPEGAVPFARRCRTDLVADSNLVTMAGYFGKRPLWTPENAEVLVRVLWQIKRGEYGGTSRLPSRHYGIGLSLKESGVSYSQIVETVGKRPKMYSPKPSQSQSVEPAVEDRANHANLHEHIIVTALAPSNLHEAKNLHEVESPAAFRLLPPPNLHEVKQLPAGLNLHGDLLKNLLVWINEYYELRLECSDRVISNAKPEDIDKAFASGGWGVVYDQLGAVLVSWGSIPNSALVGKHDLQTNQPFVSRVVAA